MRSLAASALLAGLLLAGPAASGAEVISCLGDSITEGTSLFDEEGKGGWPGRLRRALRKLDFDDASVRNFGVGGDSTFQMIARLGEAVDVADILVVLGGTNDISAIAVGLYTIDDTVSNLRFMLGVAKDRGRRAIVGTVIPRRPGARRDNGNTLTYELVQRIRELAHRRRYEVIDFWNNLPNLELSTYALYYFAPSFDTIGHPNAAGFELMAQVAAAVIAEGDAQSPVEGRFPQPGKVSRVSPNDDYEIELYDFDSGIFLPSATIVLNGEPIETMVRGNARRATLTAEGDGRRRCKVTVSVRASDKAEPPNELDLTIARYETRQNLIGGDANGDCRVDGRDLALFGPVFGKSKLELGFDPEMDFVKDGVIDGDDFARLAARFGRGDLPASAATAE